MKRVLSVFAVIVILTPGIGLAYTGMTASQLRAEIARLEGVAATLRAKLQALGALPTQNTATISTQSGCLRTHKYMARGARGDSVTLLQEFLHNAGIYPANLITGYFGPATERAVKQWQASHGVVSYGSPRTTGFGRVGPSTLRAMQRGCPGGVYTARANSQNNTAHTGATAVVERYSFSVNPTFGSAPLTVTAKFSIEGSSCTSYILDWGDGTMPVYHSAPTTKNCATQPISVSQSHSYANKGKYNIVFKTARAPIYQIKQVADVEVTVN